MTDVNGYLPLPPPVPLPDAPAAPALPEVPLLPALPPPVVPPPLSSLRIELVVAPLVPAFDRIDDGLWSRTQSLIAFPEVDALPAFIVVAIA